MDKKPRFLMKRSKKLLWKSVYKLDEEESEKVQKLLEIDPRLQKAYALKNKLYQWFKKAIRIKLKLD
ncbi:MULTISPECIES: transposase [Virgibacillus]|uniref:transposase n=2 Tax=Virgibacillus TaxID=84406 RepID=UPI001BCD2717|nr:MULTISPECIES: transposase [Virgibacillus]MBS7426661.1 transposase [Virgibacillus sp. 19R1-5]